MGAVAVKTRLLAVAVPERARAACRGRATGRWADGHTQPRLARSRRAVGCARGVATGLHNPLLGSQSVQRITQSAVRITVRTVRTADCIIRCTDHSPYSGLHNPLYGSQYVQGTCTLLINSGVALQLRHRCTSTPESSTPEPLGRRGGGGGRGEGGGGVGGGGADDRPAERAADA